MNRRAASDLQRLSDWLDRYGADLERFPAAERVAARALLASNEDARALLAEAAALSRLLDGLAPLGPSAALTRAVAEVPLRHGREVPQRGWTLGRSAPLRLIWGGALFLAIGAGLGTWSADLDATASVSATADAEWNEFAELGFATDLDRELAP